MQKTIYCISGLGADEKVFKHLRLNGYEFKFIPWLQPKQKENIRDYAKRMAAYIEHDSPILLGVSFGGMIGIEIAKQMQLQKLIIVSSIKSTGELPVWMKLVGSLKLHKFLPARSYKFTETIDNDRLGVSTPEEKEMVRAYRKNVDPVYFNWAIHEVLNWKNNWHPENLIHIHGDRDKIFPIKKINATCIIKNGTHLMIYNRAKEIGEYIEQELQ